ncbi:MAG: DUF6040 family protein [Anaerovoracaceae bacterium]
MSWLQLLTIATTKRFKTDLMAVVDIICGTAVWAWEKTLMMANSALNMCHSIPNEIVATITGYLLGAVVIIAITGGIIAALVYGGYALFKFYNEKYADTMSAVVTLISFALLVWLGDFISDMVTWNLVVVFLMIQAGYICLRRYMEKQ